jgi:hypothetical protein
MQLRFCSAGPAPTSTLSRRILFSESLEPIEGRAERGEVALIMIELPGCSGIDQERSVAT